LLQFDDDDVGAVVGTPPSDDEIDPLARLWNVVFNGDSRVRRNLVILENCCHALQRRLPGTNLSRPYMALRFLEECIADDLRDVAVEGVADEGLLRCLVDDQRTGPLLLGECIRAPCTSLPCLATDRRDTFRR